MNDFELEDCPDCKLGDCYNHEVVIIFNRPDVSTFSEAIKIWQSQKIPPPTLKVARDAIVE